MALTLEKCGIEITVVFDEFGAEVSSHETTSDTYSQEKEEIFERRAGKTTYEFLKKIDSAESRVDLTEVSSSANEIANFAKITGNDKIITNIVTSLNMALLPSEKELLTFGETRRGEDFEMEYADIVDDLHRICTDIKYSDIHDKGIYEISRMVVQKFMNIYLTSSTSLPYNKALHQNWNYEYGTEV